MSLEVEFIAYFLEISTKRAIPDLRALERQHEKLKSFAAAKRTAPCFGFVDACRRSPIPTPGP